MWQETQFSKQMKDALRDKAWCEVRELLDMQLAPLGKHAFSALAP
jgi:hypothetical protein